MKPTWNVFVAKFSNDRPERFNIFEHHSFREGCNKAFAECKHDKATFAEEVKHELMYYYWSKYEWEVIISPFTANPKDDECAKVDVYSQVMLNWDRFFEYFWEHRKEILKYDKEMRKKYDYYGKS